MLARIALVICVSLTMAASALAGGPVRVFILAGQSNMEGKAAVTTLDRVLRDEATHDRYKHLKSGEKWTVRDDVYVTFLDRAQTPVSPLHGPLGVGFGSPKRVRDENGRRINVAGIGPELGIGWVLGEHFDEPVLLIKAAWGGRAVKQTFRPPSAMPTEAELKERLAEIHKKNPDMTLEALRQSYGSDYRKIISETNKVLGDIGKYVPGYDSTQGYKLSGFIWFQGWNDGVGQGNPDYVEQMAHFIRDLRKDLKSPKLPVVIGELGTDGPDATGWIDVFRKQQLAIASLPEFKDNVRLARTAQFWPHPPDMSTKWAQFRAAAKANEQKPNDDPTRVDPGDYYRQNWEQKYRDQLDYTSDKRYHYHGSAACYYQMGEAMGRAMLELLAP